MHHPVATAARSLAPGLQVIVLGQIDLQRRDHDMPQISRMEIGSGTVVHGRTGCANPVHGLAPGVHLGDDRLGRMSTPEATHLGRLDLIQRQVGNVHIQQPRTCANQTLVHHLLDHARNGAGRSIQMRPAFVDLRHRDGRNAKQIPLHGRAHRARIQGVIAHIGTVVDARDHQVRAIAEQTGQGDVYTVRGCAVDVAEPVFGPVNVQRGVQGQGIGFGAVVVLWGHHFNIGNGLECRVQGDDAVGPKAIVVGDQDFHT